MRVNGYFDSGDVHDLCCSMRASGTVGTAVPCDIEDVCDSSDSETAVPRVTVTVGCVLQL